MSSRFIYVVACIRISLLFKVEQYSVVCMCHVLFSHSCVDGHLGCFHHLAIANNATTYRGIQISLQVPACNSFEYIPRSGIAGSDSNSIFNFRGTTILFFIAAAPFYIPSNSAQVFQFLCNLTNTCYFLGFFFFLIYIYTSHPNECEVVSH